MTRSDTASAPDTIRQFSVHARHVDHHHARLLEEASFEAAAVAYIEDLHLAPDDNRAISVIVRDIETGREHSFHVEIDPHG